MLTHLESSLVTPRAKPLPPDERRRALLDAARPLVVEHGRAVRTKDVAAAAGVAEGTLYRVFETKDELVDAVVADAIDPSPFLLHLEDVDRSAPLEERLLAVATLFHERFRGTFQLMAAVGLSRPPEAMRESTRAQWAKGAARHGENDWRSEVGRLVVEIIEPDSDRLTVSPARLAQYLRLLAFSGSHPHIADRDPLQPRDIVDVVLHGALRKE